MVLSTVTALPVTALAAAPFTLLHVALNANVIRSRVTTNTFLGDKAVIKPAPKSEKPLGFHTPAAELDQLFVATRTQGNFTENVPLALVLAALIEANGGDSSRLGATLAVLFAARVAHAAGMIFNNRLRAVGFLGTMASFIGLGAWVGSLGYAALA